MKNILLNNKKINRGRATIGPENPIKVGMLEVISKTHSKL